MAIHQIIYRSTAIRNFGDEELKQLVDQSQIYNDNENITGVLFYATHQFLQVLEGPQAVVEQLFQRIEHDPRHKDVTLILNGGITERIFPDWSMGYYCVVSASLMRLAGYLDPAHRAALLPRNYNVQEMVTDLLHEFVEEQVVAVYYRPGARR